MLPDLKVALVGCGKIGQKHLQALVHTPKVSLVATVDTDVDKAAAAAVAFDAASYGDLEALFTHHSDLDGVIIATPSGNHRELAEIALTHGAHVLVEKPMALSAEDAMAMVAQAERLGRVLTVTQFNRLLPTVEMAMEVFRSGRMGRLVEGGISVRWARSQSYYDAAPWRGTRHMDGGVLFNQAIHALDVLLQFSGPIEEVFCFAGTLTHHIEAEDTVAATMRARSGALFTVNATTSVAEGNLEERIALVGDKGSIVMGPTVQELEFWRIPEDDEESIIDQVHQSPSRTGWQSHADALDDFVRAIGSGQPSKLSGASALHVIEVIEALMLSADQRRPVSVGVREEMGS